MWHHNDLIVAVGGAPLPPVNSPLVGYTTDWNEQQHVIYVGIDDDHVHEMFFDNGWHHNDLTLAAGAPPVQSGTAALVGYSTGWNEQQHVIFASNDDRHVHEMFFDNGWHHNDLTLAAGGAPLQVGSPLVGYATEWNQQQHVIYFGDDDDHVHELFFDNGWHPNDLTLTAGVPRPPRFSAMDGYATGWNEQQHVNYIDADGHVQELFFDNGWHPNDLTLTAGAAPVSAERAPSGYVTDWNGQQHVNYIGIDDVHVHEMFFDNGWHHNDLTLAAGPAPLPARLSQVHGYATDWNEQQHVNYIDDDGHVHELLFDNGWHHNDLTLAAGPAPLPHQDSSLNGYATGWNKQQHVNYIDADGHVHELFFD